jgi:hypothetical protein
LAKLIMIKPGLTLGVGAFIAAALGSADWQAQLG